MALHPIPGFCVALGLLAAFFVALGNGDRRLADAFLTLLFCFPWLWAVLDACDDARRPRARRDVRPLYYRQSTFVERPVKRSRRRRVDVIV
jgi:hypothetical protein